MITIRSMIDQYKDGSIDSQLAAVYGAEQVEKQRQRYVKILTHFAKTYGWTREVGLFSVPGRLEIGKEDCNGATLALEAAVDQDMVGVFSHNETNIFRLQSKGFFGEDNIDIYHPGPYAEEAGETAGIVRGILEHFWKKDKGVYGFDMYVDSQIMPGDGLSASATLSALLCTAINQVFYEGKLPAEEMAKVSYAVEQNYLGKPQKYFKQFSGLLGGAHAVLSQTGDDSAKQFAKVWPIEMTGDNYGLYYVQVENQKETKPLQQGTALDAKVVQGEATAFYSSLAGVKNLTKAQAEQYLAARSDVALAAWFEELKTLNGVGKLPGAEGQGKEACSMPAGEAAAAVEMDPTPLRGAKLYHVRKLPGIRSRVFCVPAGEQGVFEMAAEAIFGEGNVLPLALRQAPPTELPLQKTHKVEFRSYADK